MQGIWTCRRTWVATFGLGLLFVLGYTKTMDVAPHIVSVIVAVCAANATQKVMTNGK